MVESEHSGSPQSHGDTEISDSSSPIPHSEEPQILNEIGTIHYLLSQLREAIEYYEQALKISRKIGDRRNEGNWLGNLGLVYAELDQIPKAIECAKSALTILESIESPHAEKMRRKLHEWEEASNQIQ